MDYVCSILSSYDKLMEKSPRENVKQCKRGYGELLGVFFRILADLFYLFQLFNNFVRGARQVFDGLFFSFYFILFLFFIFFSEDNKFGINIFGGLDVFLFVLFLFQIKKISGT
ncbi:hypothetical protein ABFS83_03G026200 [Erythranthe nasuta]